MAVPVHPARLPRLAALVPIRLYDLESLHPSVEMGRKTAPPAAHVLARARGAGIQNPENDADDRDESDHDESHKNVEINEYGHHADNDEDILRELQTPLETSL